MNPVRHAVGKIAQQAAKIARISVYFVFVAGVLALVAGRLAWAQAKKAALETGGELVRLTEAGNLSGVYRLDMNGERVNVSSASSDQSPKALLDAFEKACQTHADGLAVDFANLHPAITGTPLHATGFPGAGILRNGDETGGVVACFAMGAAVGEAEAYKRVAAFAESGDLGKIGQVRYVTARRTASGTTHVVALWTEGSLDVKKMFPEAGDAPGTDPKDVPRPPNARRLFTAFADGTPYAVRVYESTSSPEAVLAQYDQLLPKLGWAPNADVAQETTAQKHPSRAFTRNGIDLLVNVGADKGGGSTVSVIEMGTPQASAQK